MARSAWKPNGSGSTYTDDTGFGAGTTDETIECRIDADDLLTGYINGTLELSSSNVTDHTTNLRGGIRPRKGSGQIGEVDDFEMSDELAAALSAAEIMAALQHPAAQMGQVQQAVPI